MSLITRFRPSHARRLVLSASLLGLAFAASGCIGRGDAFAGPDCEEPTVPVPPVEDTSSDSTRADPPTPNPDLDPCSAPDV